MINVNWEKAPEGATHAIIDEQAIKNYGMWRKVGEREVWRREGAEWVNHSNNPDVWRQVNREIYVEKPGWRGGNEPFVKHEVRPLPQEKPKPKKPVGWWS